MSFGPQQPTGRTACVGWTASANSTASSASMWFSRSSYALIKAACFSGSSLRDTAFGLRCSIPRLAIPAAPPPEPWASLAKPVQQRDQPRPALILNTSFLLDPGADCARRPRQRLGDPGFQLRLLLAAQAARAAFVTEPGTSLEPIFVHKTRPGTNRV